MMANRREFLKKLGLGALGMGALVSEKEKDASEDTFRVVHLTDMHVTSRRQGDKGYRKCIDSINALEPAPDLVLMGGDMVFDGLYTELEEYKKNIQFYKNITAKLNMPYHHCLGNHDVLGLSPRRKVPVDFPGLGRKMIMEEVGMKDDYYSFNHKGWHFVILNSIHEIDTEDGPGYEPRISEEQLDWLRYDLGDHQGMPTIAVSHYAVFNHTGQIKNDFDMKAMNYLILQNNRDLRLIFERHNVKALLQGHTHTSEDFALNDVWYISTQAASAAWWGGNWLGFKPGYNVLELGKNDIVDWYPVTYNWKHQLEPEDTLERERIQERKDFNARQDSLFQAEVKG